MNNLNLQITAHMATPVSLSDNWSPMLDGLLEYLWLDKKGLLLPNVTPENLIQADLPLRKDTINGENFWACSAPFYCVEKEQITRYRKRWDYQDTNLNWGKKKAKVNTTEGTTKSYDLPLKLINTPRIDWFCVGQPEKILELLNACTNIGKKRSQGKGQVSHWEVKEIETDYSLFKNSKLTRPLPITLLEEHQGIGFDIMRWAWKPPYWLADNYRICAMPENVIQLDKSTTE